MSKRRSARLDPSVADLEGNGAKRRKENDAGDSDSKRISDASAKTKQTKGKNSSPRTKAKTTARPASKAVPQHSAASKAVVKTSKPPITSQANYMGTLDGVAPPVESAATSERKKGIVLNDEEMQADLGDDMGEGEDVLEIMDSDEEKKKGGLVSEEEADESSFSEIDLHHVNDNDTASFDDNMDIEDITKPARKKRSSVSISTNGLSTSSSSKAKGKILETDFEDVQLARLAKSSIRLAICVDDMWPQGDKPSLKLLRSELGKMRNKDRLISLRKVTQSAEEKDKLIRFVCRTSTILQMLTQSF
ncbi:hypothetical protein EV360DRAFT_90069 [Lentinula raphanica]|nr:hypothetical protein EV360DRAFT_90069 [Lentinula raphanica]